MNSFVSLLVFGLKFVPIVKNLPYVQSHGTVDGAVRILDKALVAVENAAERAAADVKKFQDTIDRAAAAKTAAQAEADRAARVATKVGSLLS